MHDVLDPWLNPATWAVPFFILFIGIELAALRWLDHDDVAPRHLPMRTWWSWALVIISYAAYRHDRLLPANWLVMPEPG